MPPVFRDSFLGTRASFMLDFVCLAMVLILLVLAVSVYLVKHRRRFRFHKRLQLTLGITLAVTIVLFELDVRFVTDWQARARLSPYYQPGNWNVVWYSLLVHLSCAIPTALLWIATIAGSAASLSAAARAGCVQPPPPSPGLAIGSGHVADHVNRLALLLARLRRSRADRVVNCRRQSD